MNEQEEIYIHFANSIESLNAARRILNKIRQENGNALAAYAFQFALIEYAKPYKNSNSAYLNEKGKPLRKYKIKPEFIPERHLALHKRILNARDKIHAHLDLDVRDAKLYIQSTEKGRNIMRSQNLIDGTEEISNIDDIINLIEETLDAMYKEAKNLGTIYLQILRGENVLKTSEF